MPWIKAKILPTITRRENSTYSEVKYYKIKGGLKIIITL